MLENVLLYVSRDLTDKVSIFVYCMHMCKGTYTTFSNHEAGVYLINVLCRKVVFTQQKMQIPTLLLGTDTRGKEHSVYGLMMK